MDTITVDDNKSAKKAAEACLSRRLTAWEGYLQRIWKAGNRGSAGVEAVRRVDEQISELSDRKGYKK